MWKMFTCVLKEIKCVHFSSFKFYISLIFFQVFLFLSFFHFFFRLSPPLLFCLGFSFLFPV